MRRSLIIGAIAVLVGIIIIIGLAPVAFVNAGERGVVTTWGAVSQQPLDPGIHWRTPIAQHVIKMNVQTLKYEVPQSLAYSKDGQTIAVTSAVNYNVDPSGVVALYRDIGLEYQEKIIRPAVEDIVKQEIARYAAVEIIANRGLIRDAIQNAIRERMKGSHIIVTQFNMINEDFDDAYEAAIRDKQVAVERAKEAENKTKIVEQDAKQSVLRAQAEAETSRLQAEALKTAGGEVVIEKIKAEAMLEAAKKWNGQLPTHMIPNATIPFLNVAQ